MVTLKLIAMLLAALTLMVMVCECRHGNELIIVGGKCGPRLVMKTNKKKKGQDILLIGPECKEYKKEEEVKYIPIPMPMHEMHGMGGMHGMGMGWRRKRRSIGAV